MASLKQLDALRSSNLFQKPLSGNTTGVAQLKHQLAQLAQLKTQEELRDQLKSSSQLEDFHTSFEKLKDPDTDQISKKHFHQLLNQAGLTDSQFIDHLFDVWDVDKNGSLNYREFMTGMVLLAQDSTTEEKVKFVFKLFDADNSGFIEKKDLFKILQLAAVTGSEDQIAKLEELFNKMDSNKDNRISFDEFYNAAINHRIFVEGHKVVELIENVSTFKELEEQAKNASPDILRVNRNMSPYQVSRFQPSTPDATSPNVGLKNISVKEKNTSIAVIQLLLPDVSYKLLEHMHEIFMKIGGGDPIDRDDFHAAFEACAVDDFDFLSNLFQLCDKDKDNRLDTKEFLYSMVMLSNEVQGDEKNELLFRVLDFNHTGFIEKSELETFMKLADAAKGGKLGQEQIEKRVSDLFSQNDLDKDGKISLEEFKKGAKDHHLVDEIPHVNSFLENIKHDHELRVDLKVSLKSLRLSGIRKTAHSLGTFGAVK